MRNRDTKTEGTNRKIFYKMIDIIPIKLIITLRINGPKCSTLKTDCHNYKKTSSSCVLCIQYTF